MCVSYLERTDKNTSIYATNQHFSRHCTHMAARAYANEMLMRLGRSLDENLSWIIFVKLRSCF